MSDAHPQNPKIIFAGMATVCAAMIAGCIWINEKLRKKEQEQQGQAR